MLRTTSRNPNTNFPRYSGTMKREKNQNKNEKGFEKQSWRSQLTDGTHPYVKLGEYLRKTWKRA